MIHPGFDDQDREWDHQTIEDRDVRRHFLVKILCRWKILILPCPRIHAWPVAQDIGGPIRPHLANPCQSIHCTNTVMEATMTIFRIRHCLDKIQRPEIIYIIIRLLLDLPVIRRIILPIHLFRRRVCKMEVTIIRNQFEVIRDHRQNASLLKVTTFWLYFWSQSSIRIRILLIDDWNRCVFAHVK